MANWTRVASGVNAGNIPMNVDIGIQSVTRTSNSNVRVVYGVRFAMASNYYTSNSVAAFCPSGGSRYFAFNSFSGRYNTLGDTWYYANTSGETTTYEVCPFTIDIPVSITQTSASFNVGFGWNAYTPTEVDNRAITVSFPTGATAPTGCWCSVMVVSETQVNLSGGYGSDGGASISESGFQYSTNLSDWSNCGSTFTGSANTNYYFRYYATNSQGTNYSGNISATTYDYPKPISANNFIIGNGAKVNLYNPLGRNCTLQILQVGTDAVLGTYSGTYAGIINEEFTTDDAIKKQYQSIPNSKTGTYYAKVTYGTSVKTYGNYTYSIKDDGTENPTFGVENIIDVVDTLNVEITGDNTKFIKGHNILTGKITPMSSNYYANLDYYSISSTGITTQTKNYSTSNIDFTLNNLTTDNFIVNAVDKRALSSIATKKITLINYDNPVLTKAVITRQNGTGVYVNVSFKGNYTNWKGLAVPNEVTTAKYRYREVGTTSEWSEWISIPSSVITNADGTWEINTTFDTIFNNTSRYDLDLQVTDKLETAEFTGLSISTADAFIWKDLANKRVGINKKPTETLDIQGNAKVSGNINGYTLDNVCELGYTVVDTW